MSSSVELKVIGYRNSKGEVQDIEACTVAGGYYFSLVEKDLAMLKRADIQYIMEALGDEEGGDLSKTDYIAAVDQMVKSKEESLRKRADKSVVPKSDVGYEKVGVGCVYRRDDAPNAIYLRHLLRIGVMPAPRPAKGAIPRAKQQITEALDLPQRRYIGALKLEEGKFERVEVTV